MLKKKIMVMLLGISVMLSTLSPVYAAEYSADGQADCTVSATVASTYSVSVPATLSLAYNPSTLKYEGSYTIKAKGNILDTQCVEVKPQTSTFTMTGTNSSHTATGNIVQTKNRWVNTVTDTDSQTAIDKSSYTDITGDVSVTLTDADTYSGSIGFEFGLKTL